MAEGCNENSNGLLRKFYPKKINIPKIDTEELIKIFTRNQFLKKFGKMSQLILQFIE